MQLNKRAIDILKKAYWSSAGWTPEPDVSADDFAYAKSNGVMFDPVQLSHDEVIARALNATDVVGPEEAVNAFTASLASRRLDLRSGLGSYAVARHMRRHSLVAGLHGGGCAYCGMYSSANRDIDLNVLSFERFKWGGVRHSDPTYIALDLESLARTDRPHPTPADFAILRSIFDIAGSMTPNARLGDLDKALAQVLPSNCAERRSLIAILGYAGILVDPKKPDFRRGFVSVADREPTPWHKDDWPYPVQWWNGSFGVSQAAVDDWF